MENPGTNLAAGSVPRTMLRFFWPLLVANLLQSLYGFVDMLVVGRFVGSAGLVAVGNAAMLGFVVTSLSIGLGVGGTVRIARHVGAGARDRIRPTVDTMLTLSVALSAAVTFAVLFALDSLLALLSIPPEAVADARAYTIVVTAGTVFVFGFNAAGSLLRGMGDSRRPMNFILLAAAVNICLDLLFVGPLGLGVVGAAYATVAAQAAACAAGTACLYRSSGSLRAGRPAPRLSEAGPILRVGAATAAQLVVVNISYAVVTAMLNAHGVAVAAASGIGLKVNTFAAMPCWAFGFAVTAMAGQCLGARKNARAAKVLRWGLAFNLACSSILALAVNILAEPIMLLFAPGEHEVARIGVRYLRLCCSLNSLVYCAMYTFDAFATGAGDASVALLNSLLDSLAIRLALAWLLAVRWGWGYEGIFLAQALAPVLPAAIGAAYCLRGKWTRLDRGSAGAEITVSGVEK